MTTKSKARSAVLKAAWTAGWMRAQARAAKLANVSPEEQAKVEFRKSCAEAAWVDARVAETRSMKEVH